MSQVMSRQWTREHGNLLLAVTLDSKLVGKRIAAARERRGWTQLMFALEAGVSPSTVQRWEAGHLPPVRRLLQVAELLEVAPEFLIEPEVAPASREDEILELLRQVRAEAETARWAIADSLQAVHDDLRRIEDRLPVEEPPIQASRE